MALLFAPAVDPDSANAGGLQVVRVRDGMIVPGAWVGTRGGARMSFIPDPILPDHEQLEIRINSNLLSKEGVPYAGESAYPGGYEAIKQHMIHIHVKDVERLDDGSKRFVVVGEGQVNYKDHIEALARDGYKGYISLETHYIPLAGSPEQGSRLCLAALKHLVDTALRGGSEV